MGDDLTAPPVLSTPAENLFEDPTPPISTRDIPRSHEELISIYEIERTASELAAGKWRRVALQFPDVMLPDAPWVAETLATKLSLQSSSSDTLPSSITPKFYILADTSYSSCCVDEIAAEHVCADVIVHYGRACLSPTARLPTIHIFTKNDLDMSYAMKAFRNDISEQEPALCKIIVMADVTYQDWVPELCSSIRKEGYIHTLETIISRNPKGKLPNRIIVEDGEEDISEKLELKEYSVFHIGAPPTALLLALSSRVKSLHVLPTPTDPESFENFSSSMERAKALLSRRFAKLLAVASGGIIGILVNTLSVANFQLTINQIRHNITESGKKSYTVVVGKLNPAKLANFAEVDGWVVIGCWESGLVEGDGFFKPVITPFELYVALGPGMSVWGLEWWAGIEVVENWKDSRFQHNDSDRIGNEDGDTDRDDEDAPPDFDLRTGKLVSSSRPMRKSVPKSSARGKENKGTESALALRPKAEVAMVKGVVSPGAEFLRTQRTWTGLGSDYDTEERSTIIEEGRSGIARGYIVGDEKDKR